MTIDLSAQERRAMINEAASLVASKMIKQYGDDLEVLSAAQVCGMLDVTPKTLSLLPIPKIDLLGNARAIRYRASEVVGYLESKTIKQS